MARELHEDGTPHVHVFAKYSKKVEWKSDKWDIGTYHGNYQVAKSWKAVERYCKKDGDYLTNIDVSSARDKKGKMLERN